MTKAEYIKACDRIRKGKARPGDELACDIYETKQMAAHPIQCKPVRWYDLPIAKRLYDTDRKAFRS